MWKIFSAIPCNQPSKKYCHCYLPLQIVADPRASSASCRSGGSGSAVDTHLKVAQYWLHKYNNPYCVRPPVFTGDKCTSIIIINLPHEKTNLFNLICPAQQIWFRTKLKQYAMVQ